MTFEQAIIESIRQYYEGQGFSIYEEASGKPTKYSVDYFDSIEDEMLSEDDEDDTNETD